MTTVDTFRDPAFFAGATSSWGAGPLGPVTGSLMAPGEGITVTGIGPTALRTAAAAAIHSTKASEWQRTVMALSDAVLQDLYTWVDQIPLSRPKRNIARDFSDGGRLDCVWVASGG